MSVDNNKELDIKESEQETFNKRIKKVINDIDELIDMSSIQSKLEESKVSSIDLFSKNSIKKIIENHKLSVSSDDMIADNKNSKQLFNVLMQVPKISKLLIDLSIKGFNPCLVSKPLKKKSLFSKIFNSEEVYKISLK